MKTDKHGLQRECLGLRQSSFSTRAFFLLLTLAFSLQPLAVPLPAATVVFTLTDFTGTPATNKLTLSPLSTPRTDAGRIVLSDRSYFPGAAGIVTVSNLITGLYDCSISGRSSTTTFRILVPDTNAVLQASDLVTTTNSIPGGLVGYTQSSSDARYVQKIGSWSSSQVLSNAIFRGSTNIFQFTNGAVAGYALVTDGTNWFAGPMAVGGGDLSFTNLYQIASDVLTNLAANADQTVTNAQAGNAGISVLLSAGTLWITNNWTTNGFVGITITNGLAAITYVDTSVNGASNVLQDQISGLQSATNLYQLGTAVLTNLANNAGNTVTNAQAGNAGISVLLSGGTLWITNNWTTNGFVGITITNGLAAITYVDTSVNGASNVLRSAIATLQSATNLYQLGTANGTNWGTVATNAYVSATNGSARGLTIGNATASRAAAYDANGVLTNAAPTVTELNLLSGQTTLAFQPTNNTLTQWGTVATNAYVSATNGSARGLTIGNATA